MAVFRRLLRMTIWLTIAAAALALVAKLLSSRGRPAPAPVAEPAPWRPLDTTPPTQPQAASEAAAPAEAGPVPAIEPSAAWVAPEGDACPAGYPVKAKMSSGIYHVPGGSMYARTRPDRCYASAEAAAADGLRPTKR